MSTMYLPDPTVSGGWGRVEVVESNGDTAVVRALEGAIRRDMCGRPLKRVRKWTVDARMLRDKPPRRVDWSHLMTEEPQ